MMVNITVTRSKGSMWMLKRVKLDGTFRKGQATRSGLITTIPWHLGKHGDKIRHL